MVPLRLAALPFLVEVYYDFVVGVWEVELLVAGDLVGCIGPDKGMRLMCIVLRTSLTSSLAPVVLFRWLAILAQGHFIQDVRIWSPLRSGG